jgi:two-component system response regulator RegX3
MSFPLVIDTETSFVDQRHQESRIRSVMAGAGEGKEMAKLSPGKMGTTRRRSNLRSVNSAEAAYGKGPRILFVEDEEGIYAPFSNALRRAGFDPILAPTVERALSVLAEEEPDLVLLDLTLPDGDGRDIARRIRSSGETPIIMLTARGTEADRVIGLEIGADDYVVKPFSSAEVIARIRAVLRRSGRDGSVDETTRLEIGPLTVDQPSRRATLDGEELELTRKEYDLLALLARRAGSVVSREEIMAEVWDPNWWGPTKTLDVHVSALRRKLGDDPADPRFIHTVRGVGLRFATGAELEG